MHVAVDSVGAKHGGGAEVLLSFLTSAISDARIASISLFTSPPSVRRFQLPPSPKVRDLPRPRAEGSLGRVWWYERGLAREVQRSGADAVLCLNGAGNVPSAVPRFALVQQSLGFSPEALRAMTLPERLRVTVHHALMRRACSSATWVLAQTETMREWIARDFSISLRQIEVIPPCIPFLPPMQGVAPALAPMRATSEGRRILYVGSLAGYKNVSRLATAIPEVRRRAPQATLFVTAEQRLVVGDGTVGVGHLSRAALREAYELATVLVMPSLVETVGLPLLEAMSVGTPVLAADRPYAREICQDAALYFDPLRTDDLACAVARVLSDRSLRSDLRHRGLARASHWNSLAPGRRVVDLLGESLTRAA